MKVLSLRWQTGLVDSGDTCWPAMWGGRGGEGIRFLPYVVHG